MKDGDDTPGADRPVPGDDVPDADDDAPEGDDDPVADNVERLALDADDPEDEEAAA